ncbi:MAG TPA: glycosyltransferase [Thermoanaerobaculia bacterium]|nr:glycosyltransferase [Thermoanaerobaculia bacterium]
MSGSPEPLVSVAVATRNGARYLREQLDSIYAQTWTNLEVVATDDASTDGTAGILAGYARERGLRFEVNPAPLGLVKNFERAIWLCQGDFIALSDQDDVWKPEKIATLVERIGGATLIYGNIQEHIDLDGSRKVEEGFEPIFRFARAHGSGRPTRHLLAENWVVSHSVMFRRELAGHALPIPPHQRYHDGWLALVASKLGGIVYLDERLQVYRRHKESLTYAEPEERMRQESLPRALSSGRFRDAWRSRCAAETARLTDALALPLLDEEERAFVGELLAYYRSGLSAGSRWRSFRSGLRVAPYFSTAWADGGGWKVPLRALLGGL